MRTMMRAWFKENRKTVVFVAPPFPSVGDVVNMPNGTQLTVKKVKAEEGFEIAIPKHSEAKA